jgi:hypothetical protein
MRYRPVLPALFALFLALFAGAAIARPLVPEQVPEPLKPWTNWVLWDHEDRACPFANGNPEDRRCVWPTRLELALDERGGRFAHNVQVYAERWTGLPGDAEHWPQEVQVDGKPAVVLESDEERPGLRLPPGPHAVAGRFAWDSLPENLNLPDNTGVIALTVNGKPVPIPVLNEQGQLWIHDDGGKPAGAPEITDTLALKAYRRIADGVPVRVSTHLDLDVSGRSREVLLQGALLEGAIPLQIFSALPARLEPDGRMRVQVRPGHWTIEVTARHPGEIAALALRENPEPWPREEIWAFDAKPQVRLVEIEGVPPVDPRQTELPEDWKAFPAYRLEPGATMAFKQIRRGDPEPEPDSLTLRRRIWLDFDGKGYTVNDAVGGRMTRDWRLNVRPGVSLGRVSIDGEPQSITRDEQTGGIGVEVRRGALNLSADSRLEGKRTLPATGWDKDFRQLSAELNLPPGWRLFTTTGVDNAPGTWTASWTLLDLFVVLIIALAVARLWNWPAAAFALVTLLLLWHEPGAPRYVWLNLLAAAALLRVLPAGQAAGWVRLYRNLAVLALVLIAVPFMVDQVRFGLYPQLQRPWASTANTAALMEQQARVTADQENLARERQMLDEKLDRAFRKAPMAEPPAAPAEAPIPARKFREIDPNAITQTGPGLPQWQWTQLALTWNGPALRSQEVGLVLLSPAVNLLLNLLRVVLLLGLAWLLLGGRPDWRGFRPGRGAPLLLLPLLLFLPEAKADFPSPEMLETLRARLLAPPDCQPHCAEIPFLKLDAGPGELRETLEIHAQAKVGVPLPAQLGQWLPSRAEVDGRPAEGLFRTDDGFLWLMLDPGRHTVALSGPLPPREQVQIPLPLKPHRVEAAGDAWQVEGIRDNGVPDVQLQLLRIARDQGREQLPTLEARPLPPFLEVRRILHLGLDWRIDTVVERVSPADSPVAAEIPLLPGESVVTGGLHVRDGKIAVNLLPGQSNLAWQSVLEKQPAVQLQAPQTTDWTEIWQADVSPIWHMRSEGLVVVHHEDPAGNWLPEWRPWPGESVILHITRPVGVPGSTLTLDSSDLRISPGERATDATLTVNLRSSRGGQHGLKLPEGAVLQSVAIDGSLQPIRQQGRSVSLPIRPGAQTATLVWRSEAGIRARFRAPEVDLGAPSVNASTHISPGRDRWVLLLGGPPLGPAVLFWGVLAVILLLSLALSRLPLSPLPFRQWALLGVGLSQVPVYGGVIVAGWLLALAWRAKAGRELDDSRFNVLQIGLALLTLAALAVLFEAIEHGLLGLPSMQIAGNGSDAYNLNWYQDRSDPGLPRPWVLSAPLWVYRMLMLAWALWLAYSLLDWLRWGWNAYAADGLWRARKKRVEPGDAPTPGEG